ncbi:MAG: AtpZ/AtpI family protein, partial [bacterium]|nr:AtpZ/AtpI family protein [bacterium]
MNYTKHNLFNIFMTIDSNKQAWWVPGFQVFIKASAWIVAPIVIALLVGKYLDTRYDTAPWFFLGLTGFAFVFSTFGIVKETLVYMKEIEKDSTNKNK